MNDYTDVEVRTKDPETGNWHKNDTSISVVFKTIDSEIKYLLGHGITPCEILYRELGTIRFVVDDNNCEGRGGRQLCLRLERC